MQEPPAARAAATWASRKGSRASMSASSVLLCGKAVSRVRAWLLHTGDHHSGGSICRSAAPGQAGSGFPRLARARGRPGLKRGRAPVQGQGLEGTLLQVQAVAGHAAVQQLLRLWRQAGPWGGLGQQLGDARQDGGPHVEPHLHRPQSVACCTPACTGWPGGAAAAAGAAWPCAASPSRLPCKSRLTDAGRARSPTGCPAAEPAFP